MFHLIKRVKIRAWQRGLLFRDQVFVKVLTPGRYWMSSLLKQQIRMCDVREPWLADWDLDQLVKQEAVREVAEFVELGDDERALVWVDGRFYAVLGPGRYAYWKVEEALPVRVEVRNARELRFEHDEQEVIFKSEGAQAFLNIFEVEAGHAGVAFKNGVYLESLSPGKYASWNGAGKYKVHQLDLREKVLDVSGQEIMTADKVTLRMNAVVTYRVSDAVKAVSEVSDVDAALYRETQLAIRAEVGLRELDQLLSEKDAVAEATASQLKQRAAQFGIELRSMGIRDIVLPGDMKELLNQVIEARKAAEANLIKRREETAAMRSQVNTAKLLEQNDALMRLRELEVLERVAQSSNLNVVLGNESLGDRLLKLI